MACWHPTASPPSKLVGDAPAGENEKMHAPSSHRQGRLSTLGDSPFNPVRGVNVMSYFDNDDRYNVTSVRRCATYARLTYAMEWWRRSCAANERTCPDSVRTSRARLTGINGRLQQSSRTLTEWTSAWYMVHTGGAGAVNGLMIAPDNDRVQTRQISRRQANDSEAS
jgi:hypothetical protein